MPNPQKTNTEIRIWYIEQAKQILVLNEEWMQQGMPLVERARAAWLKRREICREAREAMQSTRRVEQLRERNIQKYGDPDGPGFELLCEQNAAKGLDGNDIYEAIIKSASHTNDVVNEGLGL